jgi:hypothetical protein
MMATTHILTGAAVAKVLRQPKWAWPGACLSYFVLDALPHVNPEQYFPYPAKGYVTLADVCIGLALATWLLRGQQYRRVMIGGVVTVLLVGLVENAAHLLLWFSRLLSHPLVLGTNHLVGITMQIVVLGSAVLILQRGRGDGGEVLEDPCCWVEGADGVGMGVSRLCPAPLAVRGPGLEHCAPELDGE